MGKRTALYEQHIACGGKMVDFGGWDMPIHYGSQIKEHEAVRSSVGMFDVSHMTIVDIKGSDAKRWLQYLLANDVDKLKQKGKALYTAMLNEQGGVIDDLIVYDMDGWYRTVVNCGTREKDLAWMQEKSVGYKVEIIERNDLSMLAVQGPKAIERLQTLHPDFSDKLGELAVFVGEDFNGWFISRTGYTGEDGVEIMLPSEEVEKLWTDLVSAGVIPCGLGARDTLRLEAGMNLYGNDMDDDTSPLKSGMAWTIAWAPESRDFIGRKVLEAEKAQGNIPKLVGLVLEGKGIMRAHQTVLTANGEGEITSGTFSPSLQKSIAIARIPHGDAEQCEVEIRKQKIPAKVVKLPFVRNGKALI